MTGSLVQHFKKTPMLETDIGRFEYVSDLGQGGNASVLKFKRGEHEFAIKFIPHDEVRKLQRFRDEFFCAAQLPTHKNVVDSYHFDTRAFDGTEHSLIIMKAYNSTLGKLGTVADKTVPEKREQAWQLFLDLCNGLHHLHIHHLIKVPGNSIKLGRYIVAKSWCDLEVMTADRQIHGFPPVSIAVECHAGI